MNHTPQNNPSESAFADQVRQAIRQRVVSLDGLSDVAGVPVETIRDFVAGREPELGTFRRLAYVMGFEFNHNQAKAKEYLGQIYAIPTKKIAAEPGTVEVIRLRQKNKSIDEISESTGKSVENIRQIWSRYNRGKYTLKRDTT